MVARRTWFVWHSWIGLTAGLLMFVICWSGTVAVFARDVDMLLYQRIQASSTGDQVDWQAIHDSIRRAEPKWTINQIHAPYAGGYAADVWMEDEDGVMRRIYADPATGEVTGTTSYLNVQRFFRSLHMSLFIYDLPIFGIPFGFFLVGMLSLVLLASAITSLLFYSRFWRGFFKLQTNRGSKVFWSDLHKLTGLWSLWFALLIALTGFWYLIEWKTPESPEGPPAISEPGKALPIGALVRAAQSAYPELRIRAVSLASLGDGIFEVHGQDGSVLVRDRAAKVWVNAANGQPLAVQRPRDLSLYQRWIDTADPLHFGDFGGLWSKVPWFLFGVGLSALSMTGAYLQAKRQQRHGLRRHRTAILIAYVSTLAVAVWATHAGVREMLGYGSNGGWPAIATSQLLFIATWVATTVLALSLWAWKVR